MLVPFAAYFGDIMQITLAIIATALMIISINAYRRRSEGRYLILAVAFVCLCVVSVSTVFLELFAGVGPATIQLVELYLIPSLEFLMAMSFLMALLWSPKAKRHLRIAFLVVAIMLGLAAFTAYASNSGTNGSIQSTLPTGCVRPAGGFLIIASSLGYNDSVDHGAPTRSWPVLDIPEGSNVSITICNKYQWAVGFQVVHYLQSKIETVLPGQTLTVNFVADQKGAFIIYCSIFCPIHLFLQGGELKVT